MTFAGSLACNLLSSSIYDIGKYVVGCYKKDSEKNAIIKDVKKAFAVKYEDLFQSGIFTECMKNPLIKDTIQNYMNYVLFGMSEDKLANAGIEKNKKNISIDKEDIIAFLSEKIKQRYTEQGRQNQELFRLIDSFSKDYISFIYVYFDKYFSEEWRIGSLLTNSKLSSMGNALSRRLYNVEQLLQDSLKMDCAYDENKYSDKRAIYTKLLKTNFKSAHIYLLDKFDMDKFYVPPILSRSGISDNLIYQNELGYPETKWTHLFDNGNIVYITGGAGYGKSLLLRNIICEYEKLNICDASEYLVIYADLKSFFQGDDSCSLSVIDFLLSSMIKETLIDENVIDKKIVEFYLKRGRCLILLDALDEVDKRRRQELHTKIICYFKNQNPNNKICITSRARGFLPEKDIEVLSIEPLDYNQIKKYVDNIIALGKFDESDRQKFLNQTYGLVEKGFLNSFLVLSLLLNIYKSERELPENKLELYQKCFEYISNKREKEKSQDKYDWNLISTLMKDNTFMELANLCLPNNNEVSATIIKETLVRIYKNKYISENQTENAIDSFLSFCSDRTELFVPSSGEDCYKFFHRSFFEYFYSLYLYLRICDVEKIYEGWKTFDVDSEVFELTLAMLKQQNEFKYQEMIGRLLNTISNKNRKTTIKEQVTAVNTFIICLQIIDDAIYLNDFYEFLLDKSSFIAKNIKDIHNQGYLVQSICDNKELAEKFVEKYKYLAEIEIIERFLNLYPRIIRFYKGLSNRKSEGEDLVFRYNFASNVELSFYSSIYLRKNSLEKIIKRIRTRNFDTISSNIAITKKKKEIIKKQIDQFRKLDEESRIIIEKVLM